MFTKGAAPLLAYSYVTEDPLLVRETNVPPSAATSYAGTVTRTRKGKSSRGASRIAAREGTATTGNAAVSLRLIVNAESTRSRTYIMPVSVYGVSVPFHFTSTDVLLP